MTIQEIKKSARLNLKGNYLKCSSACLLYFIISMLLTYLLNIIAGKLEYHIIPLTLIEAIFALISSVLSFGLISNILKITQNKTKSITKFIDDSILNFGKYAKIILQILIRILVPLMLFFLCIFYLIGNIIAYAEQNNFLCFNYNLLPVSIALCIITFIVLVFFALKYFLSIFIFMSDSNLTSKEIVNKSAKLMKGKKLEYITLILSFFGWILLTAIILYILGYFIEPSLLTPIIIVFYTLIRPYVVESESIFYESLGEEKENKSKK